MVMGEGMVPSTSLGNTEVRSIARSTASSHSGLPLALTMRRLTMVPSDAARTSTSVSGLPGTASVSTMLGLIRARMRP